MPPFPFVARVEMFLGKVTYSRAMRNACRGVTCSARSDNKGKKNRPMPTHKVKATLPKRNPHTKIANFCYVLLTCFIILTNYFLVNIIKSNGFPQAGKRTATHSAKDLNLLSNCFSPHLRSPPSAISIILGAAKISTLFEIKEAIGKILPVFHTIRFSDDNQNVMGVNKKRGAHTCSSRW